MKKWGDRIDFKVGTMIEIPRAALTADRIASSAEFFSFGTNDLTQMTFGYSSEYSVSELIVYLIRVEDIVCFSDYATTHINRMIREGHERNAKNYRLAVNHLERYLGTTHLMFNQLTSAVLKNGWIVCPRQIVPRKCTLYVYVKSLRKLF